ncbi:hypothetical protein AAG906_009849 [Vitis piasezkii]
MDITTLVLLLLLPCFVWLCFHFLILGSTHRKSFQARLPPGPRPPPIIGNLLEFGDKPHQSLTTLSKTTVPNVFQVANHHHFSMGFLPASAHWDNLRKICRMQIFSPQRVDAFHGLRRKVVQQLLDRAHESCSSGQAVDVGRAAFTTALNMLSNTFFSVNLAHYDSNLSQGFKDLIQSIIVESEKPILADFFPGLRLVDPQGIQRRLTVSFNKLVDIFDASSMDNDVLDGLLNLNKQHDHELSCNDIKHLLLLLKNPKAMAKAREKLSEVVETDSEILGYAVPKNAQVLVNAWAIGRDSRTWSNPNSFEPERFLESEIDVKGRDFQLIPFSGGRRICPGLLFGHRMVHLMLASLLHSFDWKLEDGMKPEDMDMDEKFGFALRKVQPLRVVPTKP